ncbi:hypothetical protein PR003_g21005 [Phytophthora rubi]|uniref:Uncharacterized protein n=1 Tax=Phytophthora rubi TaxID=129364 RepID=A0A6A4DLA1_9STRA|nr:hypothetical protein PR003_g21005 [Phytophthora rubi]
MQEPEEPFVLASVSVVCRRWPSVEDLPHAVHLIHTFTAEISKKALPDLLEHGDSSLFFRVLQAVDESVNLIHHEKLRQYRLAMQLIPSKMTLKGGKLQAMKELYKRYRGAVDDDTVRAVAAEPELPVLKWLHSCEPRIFKNFTGFEERIFRFASTNDRKGVVRWLVKLFPDTVRSLELAAGGGHLDLIKWLMKHTKWDTEVEAAFYKAVQAGHVEIAKFLYNYKPTMTKSYWPMQSITSLEIAQWFHEIKFWSFTDSVLRGAVERGHLEMVQWLHVNYSNLFTAETMNSAAAHGHLKLVKFLHANRSEGCSTKAMDAAAGDGHLEMVQWLHENRSEGCTTEAMDSAAFHGHLDVLNWLHTNRTEGCTSGAMVMSFWSNDRMNAAKWLHENRALELPDDIVDRAARRGDIEMLSWLHSSGKGRWSKNVMDEVARHGHLEFVKFLHENRREGCTKNAMIHAAANNHLDVVKWLRMNKRKASTTSAMNAAARNGHLEVVKWLHENGQGGCTAVAMNTGAYGGHLKVMKFLAANYSFNWSEKAMANAQMHGHTETVKWLYFHLGMKLLPHEVNAARNDFIDLLELMDKETDFCRNPTVFFAGCGNNHPEVAEWYKDHYGNPRKRKHCSQ